MRFRSVFQINILILSIFLQLMPQWHSLLTFNSETVMAEGWPLISAHFIHLDWWHALFNFIGLALIVQKEMAQIALLYDLPSAAEIGATVLTTITATTVIFEIIGPILTRHVLLKAGEIRDR